MPASETVGSLSAWKANDHVSLGAEKVLFGMDEENVPLSLYVIVSALADAEQRAMRGNNHFMLVFTQTVYLRQKIVVKYQYRSKSTGQRLAPLQF